MGNYPENWEHTLDVRPEDYFVQTPVIGNIYHISWAKSTKMKWKLVKIEGNIAYLETPKTKKPIKCNTSELRDIRKRILRKASRRPYLD